MPSITDFAYVYDQKQLDDYITQIKAEALDKAVDAVMNIDKIKNACESEWEGKARENFVQNLENDAKHVSEQFEALYRNLEAEVKSAQAAMANKDEELISLD